MEASEYLLCKWKGHHWPAKVRQRHYQANIIWIRAHTQMTTHPCQYQMESVHMFSKALSSTVFWREGVQYLASVSHTAIVSLVQGFEKSVQFQEEEGYGSGNVGRRSQVGWHLLLLTNLVHFSRSDMDTFINNH